MEPNPTASLPPAVVAVVVTHDPGEWFEETLAALRAQDHPNLRVMVVDAGSRDDISARVVQALPEATIHRLDRNVGYGTAANEVLERPEVTTDAEFFLFCHDDVAPCPDATRAMVETALAYGAGVVGPKLVAWDDPERLLQMGAVVDKAGVALPMVERGELDQGQYDGVREVFEVPGAFTLVQAGLFARIGGFDEAISWLGDDLSLCWRARIAGAAVITTSEARVRHREALPQRLSAGLRQRLATRHRIRVTLTSYSRMGLLRVLPQMMLWSLGVLVLCLPALRLSQARAVMGGWWWNLLRARSLWRARRHVRRFRRASDRDVRQLQVPGLVHPLLLVQRAGVGSGTRRRAVRDRAETWCGQWTPGGVVVFLVLAAVLFMGSRHLVTRGVPAVGDLAAFGPPGDLIDQWLSGWRQNGLGAEGAPPSALGVIGVVGAVGRLLVDWMGLLRLLVTVGLIPLGVAGAARLLRPTGSRWAPVGAAVAYAAVPVPYAALGEGRWAPLAAYAAAPALLGGLARASGAEPFRETSLPRNVLAIGVVTGLLAMIVPAAGVLVLVLAGGLVVGLVLGFELRAVLRVVTTALGGALLGTLLHLPWALEVLSAGRSPGIRGETSTSSDDGLGVWTLVGFDTGTLPVKPWSWGLLAAAGLAVLVGRRWRSAWTVRAWVIALCAWAAAAAARGYGGGGSVPWTDAGALQACAGAALALAVGMGVAAIERDVMGRRRRLRLRRAAAASGIIGLLVATVPVVRASLDGYWHLPGGDFSDVLAFLDHPRGGSPSDSGPARVLWLGDPDVLPVASSPVRGADGADGTGGTGGPDGHDGIHFATTEGLPTLDDRWPRPSDPTTDRLARTIQLATTQQTARLGRLLAPMAVDYVVVPQRLAPSPFSTRDWGAPPQLVEALAGQVDLERVDVDPAVLVYRNLTAVPERAALRDPDVLDATTPSELLEASRRSMDGRPVLRQEDGYGRWVGRLPADVTIFQAVSGSDRWVLEVDGTPAPRTTAFGWANAFTVRRGGSAVLRYDTPISYHLLLVAQLGLWLLVGVLAVRLRRRGQPHAEPPTVAAATLPDARHQLDAVRVRAPASANGQEAGRQATRPSPAQPGASAQPPAPVGTPEPTDPAEPPAPVGTPKPTDPAEPVQSVEPVEPVEAPEPAGLVEPPEVIEPVEAPEPAELVEPPEVIESVKVIVGSKGDSDRGADP